MQKFFVFLFHLLIILLLVEREFEIFERVKAEVQREVKRAASNKIFKMMKKRFFVD